VSPGWVERSWVQEQLATALLEPFQVGISRVQHAVVGAVW
jgi:hypothetical protein